MGDEDTQTGAHIMCVRNQLKPVFTWKTSVQKKRKKVRLSRVGPARRSLSTAAKVFRPSVLGNRELLQAVNQDKHMHNMAQRRLSARGVYAGTAEGKPVMGE